MLHNIVSLFRFLPMLAFAVVLSVSVSSHAQFADDSCDPGYYKSLESRAWLEAQREITQNQNLIFKADSVLEYTCFNQFAGIMAQYAGNSSEMETNLTNVVGASLGSYGTNFDHSYLGGRISGGEGFPSEIKASADYACTSMQEVWKAAKCMNFIDKDHDGFFTFEHYANNDDKRFLPSPCGNTADFAGNIAKALPKVGSVGDWKKDKVKTYFELMFPSDTLIASNPNVDTCGGAKSMIQTGVIISRNIGNPKRFQEMVCVVPGCHFVPQQAPTGSNPTGIGDCVR